MQVLCATVEEFSHDEQQAIYYHYYMGLSPTTIAKVIWLTEMHVVSVLGLYVERLTAKINLFKTAQHYAECRGEIATQDIWYDENNMMPVREILLPWTA